MRSNRLFVICMMITYMSIMVGCIGDDGDSSENLELVSTWGGITEDDNPVYHPVSFTEITIPESDFPKIEADDEDGITIMGHGYGEGYPYFLFKFEVKDLNKSIKVKWEGYGIQSDIDEVESKIDMFIYNEIETSWDMIATEYWENDEYVDKTVRATINNVMTYTSPQNELFILIIGPFTSYSDKAILVTDYIKVTLS